MSGRGDGGSLMFSKRADNNTLDDAPPSTDVPPSESAEQRCKIAYRVEYIGHRRKVVVFETEGKSHESLRPAIRKIDRKTTIFEAVDVNMTTENHGNWSRSNPPLTYAKGPSYIKIFSPRLISAIRHVVEYYPGQRLDANELVIHEPYAIIWHHEKALEEYRVIFRPGASPTDHADQNCANEGVFEEIGVLLEFVHNQNGDDVRKARERWAEGYMSNNMLWLFLKPGIDVYCDKNFTGEWETYVIDSVHTQISGEDETSTSITVWKLQGEDTTSFLCVTTDTIRREGSSADEKIWKNSCIPCDVAENNEEVRIMGRTGKEIRTFFEQRGKIFCRLRRKGCFGYDGLTRTNPIRPVRLTLPR